MNVGEQLLIAFVLIAVPSIIIGVPIFVAKGGPQRIGLRSLERQFLGLELHKSALPGDVSFTYHTYRGLLLWFIQDEHRVFAPPKEARELLSRLLRFNLTWGMLSYGLIFVPLIAVGNYYAQKRSILRQELDASFKSASM